MIGLLMIRSENDILAESVAAMTRYFDRILVLDGTPVGPERDVSTEVLSDFPEVVAIFHDEDLFRGENGSAKSNPAIRGTTAIRDGARQILLDEARRRFGVDNWIGILHGDEIHESDPRQLLARHHPLLDPSVRVRVVHHFLHIDDEATWAERVDLPVRHRVPHHMWPGVPETRFFFDNGVRNYRLDQHSQVVPRGLRIGPLADDYVIRQFNYRSPEQAVTRAKDRLQRGWQVDHYAQMTHNPFVATLYDPDDANASYEHLDVTPPEVRRLGSAGRR